MWIAGILVIALGALFAHYVVMWTARVNRCEGREDELLEDGTNNTSVIKEQSATLIQLTNLMESQSRELVAFRQEQVRELGDIKRELADLRRK